MLKLINLLSLVKWIIETVIAGYQYFVTKKEQKAEESHDDAVSDLKNSQTEEEQHEATRKLGSNP